VRRSQKRPAKRQIRRYSAESARTRHTLGKRLLSTGSLGEKLLALGDGLSTEANTLLRVEDGTLPHERLDTTGTAIYLVEGDLVDDLGAVLSKFRTACQLSPSALSQQENGHNLLPQGLDLLNLLGQKLGEALLQGLGQNKRSIDAQWIMSGRIWHDSGEAHLGLGGVASRREGISGEGGLEGSPQSRGAQAHSSNHGCY